MSDPGWFELRVGFTAASMAEAQQYLERTIAGAPDPNNVLAVVEASASLSAGRGFGERIGGGPCVDDIDTDFGPACEP